MILETEREAIHAVFQRLERRWNVLPIPDADEWHAYDPLPWWDFLTGLGRASELTAGRRFLDVGAGVGRNLALAHHLGWQVSAIERHGPYVRALQDLLPEADVICANALDLEEFDADVVYMYRPAVTDELEEHLEDHVLSRLRAGTVCFLPMRRDPEVWVT